ncbi:hypothetical protein D3C81_1556400 [compost metagenome]
MATAVSLMACRVPVLVIFLLLSPLASITGALVLAEIILPLLLTARTFFAMIAEPPAPSRTLISALVVSAPSVFARIPLPSALRTSMV